jgi:hypothetical protein
MERKNDLNRHSKNKRKIRIEITKALFLLHACKLGLRNISKKDRVSVQFRPIDKRLCWLFNAYFKIRKKKFLLNLTISKS